MATIYIDDKPFEVDPARNLLETVLGLGFNLPYFCWHPALGSVGACRQCAVLKFKDENDKRGKIFMACMEPAADKTRISIDAPEAVAFRKGIIEWLMTNHPHDCPVCDEGGECHLQDMTVMTGHDYRRFRFKKRTHQNQYLGPFINHEMNRCIQCYRCVRFYRDYAGGRDFDVFGAHHHVYFGRHTDGVLDSEFSGNLVEVCPTGVFTDKTLKNHYTRKWDLTMAPSICVHCSVGCNIIAGERYGSLRRVMSRYNGEVNGYFICDRGRFGYEFVNSARRIKSPLAKSMAGNRLHPVDGQEALRLAKEMLSGGRVAGIGSPRASLEANFALKNLVGEENFYAGESKKQFSLTQKVYNILRRIPVRTPSLREIEKCDAVFILGEDITNTAPMMALAVRQAARQKPMKVAQDLRLPQWHDMAVRELIQEQKGPVYLAATYPTRLDDISTKSFYGSPDDLVLLANAVARNLDPETGKGAASNSMQELAQAIAGDLKSAEKPLIISGTGCLSEALLEAAANVSMALFKINKNVRLSYALPESDSMGLAMMAGNDLDVLADSKDDIHALIVLENDLYRRLNRDRADRLLRKAAKLIVLDHLFNGTADNADLVFPVGTFAESDGTFVNNEGRAQRYYQVYPAFGEIRESWRWLGMMEAAIHGKPGDRNFFDFVAALSSSHPQFKGIENLTPPPDFRVAGLKIARQPHRYSGRTAMHAHKNVSEPKPPEDPDSPLTFTMEGYALRPPSAVIPFFWSPGWNSQQAINKYQIEVGGPLHGGDPGLRLLEPNPEPAVEYFKHRETAPTKIDWMKIVPKYHIYGGEELSSHSPAVAELAPEPYVGVSAADAAKHGLNDGDMAWVNMENEKLELKAIVMNDLSEDVIALPAGLYGFHFDVENRFATISKKRV